MLGVLLKTIIFLNLLFGYHAVAKLKDFTKAEQLSRLDVGPKVEVIYNNCSLLQNRADFFNTEFKRITNQNEFKKKNLNFKTGEGRFKLYRYKFIKAQLDLLINMRKIELKEDKSVIRENIDELNTINKSDQSDRYESIKKICESIDKIIITQDKVVNDMF